MGTLFAYAYPTNLAPGRADHTYVTCCEGGHGWGCWGGRTGGRVLVSGPASTARADAIAELDERAGITCYLINGVCHQAANRVLLPASITVRKARGYGVSTALFGVYGRPRGTFGTCLAPFHRHANVTGDLPECEGTPEGALPAEPGSSDSAEHQKAAVELLDRFVHETESPEGRAAFAVQSLDLLMRDRLGPEFPETRQAEALRKIRVDFEQSRERVDQALEEDPAAWPSITEAFDRLVVDFQERAAKILEPQEYLGLFELEPGDTVTLTDRSIAEAVYGNPGDATRS
jgi:hypothetical protein